MLTCTPFALAAPSAPFNALSQHEKLAALVLYLYRQQNTGSSGVIDPTALVASSVCFKRGCSKSRLMSYLLVIMRQKAIDAGWTPTGSATSSGVKSDTKQLCVLSEQQLLSIIIYQLCQLS